MTACWFMVGILDKLIAEHGPVSAHVWVGFRFLRAFFFLHAQTRTVSRYQATFNRTQTAWAAAACLRVALDLARVGTEAAGCLMSRALVQRVHFSCGGFCDCAAHGSLLKESLAASSTHV